MIYSILCQMACCATPYQRSKTMRKPYYLQHVVSTGLLHNVSPNIKNDTETALFTAFRVNWPAVQHVTKYQKYKKTILFVTCCANRLAFQIVAEYHICYQNINIYSTFGAMAIASCAVSRKVFEDSSFEAPLSMHRQKFNAFTPRNTRGLSNRRSRLYMRIYAYIYIYVYIYIYIYIYIHISIFFPHKNTNNKVLTKPLVYTQHLKISHIYIYIYICIYVCEFI